MGKPAEMSDLEWGMRCDLAATFRLSVRFGFNEGLGNHFSLMMPDSEDRFLVNGRGLLFEEITASNLLVVDFKGHVISGGREVRSVTYHIHAPVHAANPAAKCAIHLHPPNLTALSMIEGGRMGMAHHNNLLVNHRVAYDDAATGPASNLEEGYRLARAIGDATTLVMANHGVMTVGPTVHDAFHELCTVEKTVGYQLNAAASGLPLRRQPDHLRWTHHTGAWSDVHDGRQFLDAWRRILDREEPDYAS